MSKSLNLTQQHYSTSIYSGYIEYLLARHPRDYLEGVFKNELGLELSYLEDKNNWLSEEASEIFFDILNRVERDSSEIDFEAGRLSLGIKPGNILASFVSTFLTFEKVMSHSIRMLKTLNKVDGL